MIAEEYDAANEAIEKQLQEHFEELNREAVDEELEAHRILLRDNEFFETDGVDNGNENLENLYGLRADIQCIDEELSGVISADKEIRMPPIWQKDYYSNFMRCLNRGQQTIHQNILGSIQEGEQFFTYLTGASGTGKSQVLKAVYQTVCQTDF